MDPSDRNVVLTGLRRLARERPDIIRACERGPDAGLFDREAASVAEVEAKIIEGDGRELRAHTVKAAEASGFSAFLDSIQRSRVMGYRGPIPLVYAYAAATVRTRRERLMTEHPGRLLTEQDAIFFPFRLLDLRDLETAGIDREHMVDTSPPTDEPLPLFPPLLYQRAALTISRWRETLERRVAERWCALARPDEWLLADGTLTLSPTLAAHPRAVGVVKNHHTCFFDGDDARVMIALRAGQRSSVFEPASRSWSPVHAWYLRLRDPAGRDALWGLVRVEVAASSASVRVADLVSGWLLNETTPLTLPDAGWDRLLYPIHDCVQFLRARAPTL